MCKHTGLYGYEYWMENLAFYLSLSLFFLSKSGSLTKEGEEKTPVLAIAAALLSLVQRLLR